MTNASDSFLSQGQSLNYGPTSDTRWLNRPRGGVIVSEPREEQQTTIKREPMFWDAQRTRPMMQLVFTVVCDGSGPAAQHGWRTDERVDAADQGHRTVYIKGKDKTDAVKAQIRQHGRPGLRVGDYYYECWTGMRPGKEEGTTARTWAAMLFPGAGPAQESFFGNEQQPAAAEPAASGGFVSPPLNQHNQTAYAQPVAAANPGPPPQFGQPAAQQAATPAPVDWNPPPMPSAPPVPVQQPAYAPAAAPGGFGAPPVSPQPEQAPPANPWGQAPPVQNPYAG